MEINVTTVYTEKLLKEFILFTLFRGKHYKTLNLLFRVLGPLLLIPGIYVVFIEPFLVRPQASSDSPPVFLFVLGLFLVLYIYYSPRQVFKKSQNVIGAVNQFMFLESEFHTNLQSIQVTSSAEIKYNALHCVYETNAYFFLFTQATVAHVVDKNNLPDGAAKELRALLQKQVKKYVVCQDA